MPKVLKGRLVMPKAPMEIEGGQEWNTGFWAEEPLPLPSGTNEVIDLTNDVARAATTRYNATGSSYSAEVRVADVRMDVEDGQLGEESLDRTHEQRATAHSSDAMAARRGHSVVDLTHDVVVDLTRDVVIDLTRDSVESDGAHSAATSATLVSPVPPATFYGGAFT